MSYHHPSTGIARLSKLFGVTRQAWYQSVARQSQVDYEEGIILWEVAQLRRDFPRLGSHKLHHELTVRGIYRRWGIKMGRDKLHDLLRSNDLMNKWQRKRTQTTDSKHPFYKYKDLLKAHKPISTLTGVNQVWVGDITYIPVGNGFSYLSLITDACSRKIVGWHLATSLSAKESCIALTKALEMVKGHSKSIDLSGLIHHSDRGIQYCSHEYTNLLKQEKIQISMTQSGDPYDNALAERMNRTIKEDMLNNRGFTTHQQAYEAIERAIAIYNEQYPHGSLGYQPPNKVHRMSTAQRSQLKQKWYRKSVKPQEDRQTNVWNE